ncbi:hypothetical protein J2Y45_001111 [Dyadobacter sp. BE34]|uniref:Uncharacterized protein n=1 Tax=Dyadobacter fermentans TaxID=94254 RepID=A0ABU1QRU5_9BACT|nr:hypothetical protein [Dyadobacter fermentans]MDR7041582.1 hypothetical protein [Dyadobacter sp. BE242]MDR7195985.1 hypothetical protein [Dyadobacter sp. BE34]MDR7213470.1 hypothetical protein [Dyadobacter sp. BE31]MDR7261391.1 hypothetical protein [Dyadobacter sp. BE32]
MSLLVDDDWFLIDEWTTVCWVELLKFSFVFKFE